MTRIDTAREAAGRAKGTAAQYAGEARSRIAPHLENLETAVEQARHAARSTVDEHLAPRWEQARTHVPPAVGDAVARTRSVAAEAANTAGKAAANAREAAGPLAQEAQLRGGAALAALRGRVTAAEIERLAARVARRRRRARALRRIALASALGAGAAVAALWWRRRSSPEWLVEPERAENGEERPATMADEISPDGVAGSTAMPLDPEVEAKAEDDGTE